MLSNHLASIVNNKRGLELGGPSGENANVIFIRLFIMLYIILQK